MRMDAAGIWAARLRLASGNPLRKEQRQMVAEPIGPVAAEY